MEPILALERIAYLLDRSREPTYRVRAYLKAAEVLRSLPPGEVVERVQAGTLTELAGIGPKTAAVITESLQEGAPAYLRSLEESGGVPVGAGSELLAALRGDCHTHSDWSDGGAPVEVMARTARALGHEYLALTDHSPRLTVANGLDRDRLLAQLEVVAELNEVFVAEAEAGEALPFRLLTGIEVDILADGRLDQDDDLLERLDVVVASAHSLLRMEEPAMTRRLAVAVSNPNVDVLGHCTGRMVVGKGRPESTFDAELVFTACHEAGTAVEVNCRPERLDPPRRLLSLANELGCSFTIDTDAHAPGQLEWQPYGADRAASCDVPAERILNTWPVEQLLRWTAT